MIRKAAWAGRFYPRTEKDIRLQIADYSVKGEKKINAKAVIVPHAGYIYSGRVAGEVYSRTKLPNRFIIVSPNHWEGRTSVAMDINDQWETPLGAVSLDKEMGDLIFKYTGKIKKTTAAHEKEHAIEVQLPFLQYHLNNDFRFIPITMLTPGISILDDIAKAFASAVKDAGRDVLLIASSDMSHYISQSEAQRLDGMAIEKMISLDPHGLYKTVTENGISMCGLQAVYTVMTAALELGCLRADLIKYSTSGDASGDYEEVVGYAGVILS
jgi:AmmeMemoRadiSam system protein B